MAAFFEQSLRVCLLEVFGTNLSARDLRGNRQNRNTVAVTIEESVDQMEVAGSATTGAHGKTASHSSIGARREGGHFLVAHRYPTHLAVRPQRIGDSVQRVSDEPVYP